jgi:hypothetical protein
MTLTLINCGVISGECRYDVDYSSGLKSAVIVGGDISMTICVFFTH